MIVPEPPELTTQLVATAPQFMVSDPWLGGRVQREPGLVAEEPAVVPQEPALVPQEPVLVPQEPAVIPRVPGRVRRSAAAVRRLLGRNRQRVGCSRLPIADEAEARGGGQNSIVNDWMPKDCDSQ